MFSGKIHYFFFNYYNMSKTCLDIRYDKKEWLNIVNHCKHSLRIDVEGVVTGMKRIEAHILEARHDLKSNPHQAENVWCFNVTHHHKLSLPEGRTVSAPMPPWILQPLYDLSPSYKTYTCATWTSLLSVKKSKKRTVSSTLILSRQSRIRFTGKLSSQNSSNETNAPFDRSQADSSNGKNSANVSPSTKWQHQSDETSTNLSHLYNFHHSCI